MMYYQLPDQQQCNIYVNKFIFIKNIPWNLPLVRIKARMNPYLKIMFCYYIGLRLKEVRNMTAI